MYRSQGSIDWNHLALLETGAEGRITKRNGLAFDHDKEGRRQSDDRFSYAWSWRGELLSVTINDCWPAEQGSQLTSDCPKNQYRPPYSGQQIRYEYDALGSLLAREHRGAQTAPGDDATRPFIERREYLWDGSHLMAEIGKAADGTIRWRKSYVPGASGLDDAVQQRVEIYSLSGADVVSDKLYSFLRDEQNTVLALVEEKDGADPRSPPTPVRYLYTPYGEAHAETSAELLSTRFDAALHGTTKPDGTTVSQTTAPDAVDGGVRLTLTLPPDPSTLAAALLVERRNTDGTWGALNAADLALGQRAGAPEELELLALSGFTKGATYRVRFQSLKDSLGRTTTLAAFAFDVPTDGTQVLLDRTYPLVYDSYFASGTTANGTFPGGQNLLFQGLWTDPVTGMGYARNRWYDARNAVWLSQDPLGDRDSVNLYGFVGLRPHELTDPLGRESFGQWVRGFSEDAFASGGFWSKTAAVGLTVVDAAFQVASVGATKKIDAAQEQLDRGEISRGQYWKKTGVAVAQTAASYAGGAGAGALGARVGVRVLGTRGVTALGVRAAGAIGGASGGVGGQLAADVVGIAAGEQEGLSSGETYVSALVVGGGIGALGAIPGRTPRDVAVNPEAPPVRPLGRPIGRPSHNAALREEIERALAEGATDLRVNQAQVTAATAEGPGVHVGANRPDFQYTNASGRRVFFEFDAPPATRAVPHAFRLLANDPSAIVYLRTLP